MPRHRHNDQSYRQNRQAVLSAATVCALCGKPPTPDDPLTVDHIVPLVHGGTHHSGNLRPAHSSCNSRRGA
jgi:5-methylcytosine-specific restriction endonuclease McrA